MVKFFRNLFGKKANAPAVDLDIHTVPLSAEQVQSVSVKPMQFQPSQLVSACAQSVGKQREHNEDTLFILNSVLADGAMQVPVGILMIADGMGGHEHGEVASSAAVRAAASYLNTKLISSLIQVDNPNPMETMQELVESAIQSAQAAVISKAPGGGTTLTIVLVVGEQITIGHVGDSRAYFVYPDGRIHPQTQDHSLVGRLVELGQLSKEEAANHPQRNVLYRAIGQAESFKPDIKTLQTPHPGFIMLCSDGLWGVVDENELFRIINSSPTLAIACNRMVDTANGLGGPDNISVILAQYLC